MFSEDIDLTFSRDGWGFDGDRDPLHAGLSGKKRAALVGAIAARAALTVRDVVVPGLEEACRAALGPSGWSLEIAKNDDQAVLFRYPAPAASYTYGQPVVKAEFGARGEPWPTAPRMVRPYLEDLYTGIASAAVVEVATLGAERTFWEKATLLHALHHGVLAKPDRRVERLSRHAYDVHQMWSRSDLRERFLAGPALLQAVVRNKQVFFKEGKAKYELVQRFSLNATPHAGLEERLRADYKAMESMFFPDASVPTFDELLVTLREVDAAVAAWARG